MCLRLRFTSKKYLNLLTFKLGQLEYYSDGGLRQLRVINNLSKYRGIEAGLPQVKVLSLLLFSIFTIDFLNSKLVQYAYGVAIRCKSWKVGRAIIGERRWALLANGRWSMQHTDNIIIKDNEVPWSQTMESLLRRGQTSKNM